MCSKRYRINSPREKRQFFTRRPLSPIPSPIDEIEFVHDHGVGRLLVVAIHLIVGRDAIPTAHPKRREITVNDRGYPVQRNGVVEKLIVPGSLHLPSQVVPRIVYWITGDACRNPLPVNVVPD